MTTVLSTTEGYNLASHTIRRVVTTVWNGLTRAARFTGRLLHSAAKAVVEIGHVSATGVDLAYTTFLTVSRTSERPRRTLCSFMASARNYSRSSVPVVAAAQIVHAVKQAATDTSDGT